MEQNVYLIAQQIQANLGITPYDEYNIWRLQQLNYYANNFTTPISRNPPPDHAWFLFDQINLSNQCKLSPYDFSLGSPTPYSNPLYPQANTQITISAAELTGYMGGSTIYYQRVDLSTVLNAQTANLTITAGDTLLSQIIGQINTAYGLDLQTGDYIDTQLPALNVNGTVLADAFVTIAADPSSLKYTGTYNYALAEVNNLTTAPVTTPNRLLFVYSIPALDLTNLQASQAVLKMLPTGVLDASFVLARNLTSATAFTITDAQYDPVTSQLYLIGNFSVTFTSGVVTTTGDYTLLTLDVLGNITAAQTASLYTLPVGGVFGVNRSATYRYGFNPTAALGQSIFRYTLDGQIDPLFTTQPLYVPASVFSQASGTYYTVSPVYTAANPTDPQGISVPLVRIDRYLATGLVDPTFTTVYLTSSQVAAPVPTVTDILEIPGGLIQILVNQSTGFGTGSNVAVVNHVPLIATDSNSSATTPWIPIISLLENGTKNTAFSNTLNVFANTAVCSDPTKIAQPGLWLNYASGMTSFLSYILNPANALPCFAPVRFNAFGVFTPYAINVYANLPIYENCQITGTYSDGTDVIQGTLASVNMNGVMSTQKSFATILAPDGTQTSPQTVSTGVFPQGTVSLLRVFSF